MLTFESSCGVCPECQFGIQIYEYEQTSLQIQIIFENQLKIVNIPYGRNAFIFGYMIYFLSAEAHCMRTDLPEYDTDGDGVQVIATLKSLRSPLDGLRSSPVKASYTDLYKIPG
jgi:hypothetical protein